MVSDDRELRISLELLIEVFTPPHYAQSFAFSLAITSHRRLHDRLVLNMLPNPNELASTIVVVVLLTSKYLCFFE